MLGRQIKSPLDLERDFGLIGGDIFHGALSLNQLFSARPMLGYADYRGALYINGTIYIISKKLYTPFIVI